MKYLLLRKHICHKLLYSDRIAVDCDRIDRHGISNKRENYKKTTFTNVP